MHTAVSRTCAANGFRCLSVSFDIFVKRLSIYEVKKEIGSKRMHGRGQIKVEIDFLSKWDT